MIHNSDVSDRRILTFPAVHPCEAISPATLLRSLISLAGDICGYRSKFFASNDWNARETIRHVGNLLVFLEEIRESPSDLVLLPDSAVLSFSELHLAFQKIRYLLEDCSRGGARLWILMKSDRAASWFLQLNRTIPTALDVLRLDRIDVGVEIKELIELVMRQTRKGKFEFAREDKELASEVFSILGNFEHNFITEATDLRRILHGLGIQSWIDCNEEIKFLEEEFELESSRPDAGAKTKDLTLLSNLIGFTCYCRCLLFDEMPSRSPRQTEGRGDIEVLKFLNPDDFRCPISLEIMSDPVTTATGQTYDRSSILKWFRAGNSTCPKTGEKLMSFDLVPNLVLRRLIHQFCSKNSIPIAESGRHNRSTKMAVAAGSPAAKMAAAFLVGRLQTGTIEEKNKAAFEIRLLTKRSIFNRSCFTNGGAIPHLLSLLSSADSRTQENAMAALLNLSKHSNGKVVIVENGGLKSISQVTNKGLKVEIRQLAAAALYYLSSVQEHRRLIGEIPEAIPSLIELIKDGNDHGKKNALVALVGLLMYQANHPIVLAAGAVPILIHVLTSSQSEDLITDSLAVLSNLAENRDGALGILLQGGSLPMLVGIFSSLGSRAGKEHCVSSLLALCINGGRDVVSVLVKNTSLMGLLYSQLAEGTARASKKASSLISLLHRFWERNSNGSIAPRALPQDRFVHVW